MGYSAEAMPSFQSYLTCMKFDTSGELDTSFGNNGIVISDLFNSETNTGYEVKLQNDGKIVGIGITNEANTSNKDIALIRLNNQVLDIEDTVLEPHIVIFPNPTKHFLNFTLRNNITGFSINIFNVNGQKVYESKYLSKIDVSAFESGCYFVEIITGKGYIYKKVVVK